MSRATRARRRPASGGRRARRLADLGEFELIARIERIVAGPDAPTVSLGVGDDAALLRPRAAEDVAVSTDAFVDGVHFRFDQETPRMAGRRAMAAALSDLAAMGARPLGVTCALQAPPETELAVVLALARGLADGSHAAGAPLVGGNIARARELSIVLSAVGAVRRGRALRRDGARSGDRLCVTGELGGQALQRARGRVRRPPVARLEAGRRLVGGRLATACIDISDGLLADLGHLCRASGLGAEVDAAQVPRPGGLGRAARGLGLDPEALVLAGGEDYELLFAAPPRGPSASALAGRLGLPVTEIGRLGGRGLRVRGGERGSRGSGAKPAGWQHF